MKTIARVFQFVVGLSLLMALVLGTSVLFQAIDKAPGSEVEQDPYPPPGEVETTPRAIDPTPIIIGTGTEQITYPTRTPFPTATPRPTPTRRPGPTATPYPIQEPAHDASGEIYFYSTDQEVIMSLPVDGQGSKLSSAAPITLDFDPILGDPSPDGRYLLLLRPVEPVGIPYVLDRETQQLWPLFRNHPLQQSIVGQLHGWHPDSRHVLFWLFNNEELWLADIQTGDYIILALTEGPVQGAAISPDGQEVAYVDRRGGDALVWIASTSGSDAQPLFDPLGLSYVFGWSPDGTHILHIGRSSELSKEDALDTPPSGGPLWIMDPEGQNRRALSAPFIFGYGFEPSWSPDGQWLALTGLDEGKSFGCAKEARGEEPDDTPCVFEGTAIYIENVETGEIRRLAAGVEPTWSPDGTLLAFISDQSGSPEVWRIRSDGTGLQQLTLNAQARGGLIWATNGR